MNAALIAGIAQINLQRIGRLITPDFWKIGDG
jgi:hypothetical protein